MLHIMKLAVGSRDIADLRAWQAERLRVEPPLRHRTRSTPKRAREVVDGGSIYWVVAGMMIVRQRIVAIEDDRLPDGSACAAFILDPALVSVEARLVKPFQGWRYLDAASAPPDIGARPAHGALPDQLRAELLAMGLL